MGFFFFLFPYPLYYLSPSLACGLRAGPDRAEVVEGRRREGRRIGLPFFFLSPPLSALFLFLLPFLYLGSWPTGEEEVVGTGSEDGKRGRWKSEGGDPGIIFSPFLFSFPSFSFLFIDLFVWRPLAPRDHSTADDERKKVPGEREKGLQNASFSLFFPLFSFFILSSVSLSLSKGTLTLAAKK